MFELILLGLGGILILGCLLTLKLLICLVLLPLKVGLGLVKGLLGVIVGIPLAILGVVIGLVVAALGVAVIPIGVILVSILALVLFPAWLVFKLVF